MHVYKHYSKYPMDEWRWPNFSPGEMACNGKGKLAIDEDAGGSTMAFINGPASAQGDDAQRAWRLPPDMKFIVNGQRLFEGDIPTAIEAFATSDRDEITDVAGVNDMSKPAAMIADIYAQRATPQSLRTQENLAGSYVPPVNWLPLS